MKSYSYIYKLSSEDLLIVTRDQTSSIYIPAPINTVGRDTESKDATILKSLLRKSYIDKPDRALLKFIVLRISHEYRGVIPDANLVYDFSSSRHPSK